VKAAHAGQPSRRAASLTKMGTPFGRVHRHSATSSRRVAGFSATLPFAALFMRRPAQIESIPMSYFSDLALAEPILRALAEKGYTDPTPSSVRRSPR
jgi:hypothetical protein